MQDFEKLGQFYLGRTYDLAQKRAGSELLLYDSKDLVTHAVCVGMTGSGKTGLCIALLEEAAIDGVPAIVIDPKGDLSNLLLTFPTLAAAEFEPWVNADDARRKGVPVEALAAGEAVRWKDGLASWGQDGARIARLRDASDFTIYTPGSTAGVPLSIVKSFAAPEAAIAGDAELLKDRIQTAATSILGLVGIAADPIRSREHILLSSILQSAWSQGRDLTLPEMIQQVQTPPLARIGVMDVETFYPGKDRFELALALNNLLAAPGFDVWMQGEPLDIARLLHRDDGKPRMSIVSIAHLSDAERMFFVSLLLNSVVGWMRSQPGTTSLRAIVYMDEIVGYFPPVSNPPSKAPLLTLLKQARAFGVGVVLATQNPVDLDYKGLANTGTWFLGRLQTERDQARVLDGLEGAASAAAHTFDRSAMERTLAGLGSRIFLMHNVHEDGPVVFESRWALSYLRGPLGRGEIQRLMAGRKTGSETQMRERPAAQAAATSPAHNDSRTEGSGAQPVLPAGVAQYFLPLRQGGDAQYVYQPAVYGAAQVRYVDAKLALDAASDVTVLTPFSGGPVPIDWSTAVPVDIAPSELEPSPADGVSFAPLPANAVTAKSADRWRKDFTTWVYGTQSLALLRAPNSPTVSRPAESERDFRVRLQQESREARDTLIERLRQKYAPKTAAAQERLRRAEQTVGRESQQAKDQTLQTAISFGTTLLGAFMGRKVVSASTLGRATTAARGVGRSLKESQDIDRAKETVEAIRLQLQQLDDDLRAEVAAIEQRLDAGTAVLEPVPVKPKKANIDVKLVALVWAPHVIGADGEATPAW
jgi:hypothetical protein